MGGDEAPADLYPLASAIPNPKDLGYDPSVPRPELVTSTPPPTLLLSQKPLHLHHLQSH